MNRQTKPFDILLYGPLSVDFHGEQIGSFLTDTQSFRQYPGGIATLALGLVRLGLKTSLLSQVGLDAMGEFLQRQLTQEGVDISQLSVNHLISTPLRLVASDNQSYESGLSSHEVVLDTRAIAQSRALLLTSSLFLQDNSQKLAKEAAVCANERKSKVILLLDSSHAAIPQSVLPLCSLIFITNASEPFTCLQQVRKISDAIIVLLDKNQIGVFSESIPANWQETLHTMPPSHDIADIAFITGFIYAWLQHNALAQCTQLALSCQTITQSRAPNSNSLPSKAELSLFLSHKKAPFTLSQHSVYFQHLHYASTQAKQTQPYFVFNMGSQAQWCEWGKNYTNDVALIDKTLSLTLQGLRKASANNSFRLMTDDCPNVESLAFSQIIRTVDAQDIIPLQFKGDPDISRTLITWPKNHSAKVTMQYHPDDPFALRKQQESTLSFLHRATRATFHDLWVDIVSPAKCLVTSGTLSHIVRRFYETGIYPNIWQITPPRDQRSWDSIERVITENDPYCQGVVISAQNILNAQLPFLIQSAAKQKYAKGLVVNRSILHPVLEAWFAQKLTEEEFMQHIAEQFSAIISLWEKSVSQKVVNPVSIELERTN